MYLESFGNPRKFARLARRIARRKPIVAVKSGRTAAGTRGAASHTAALASPDVAVDALFRQAGVIRVDTLEQLFDTAIVLAHQPLPRGPRVAIVSNGGGPAILAADACEAVGLEVPELSEATQATLRSFVAVDAAVRNPVDLVASASAPVLRAGAAHAARRRRDRRGAADLRPAARDAGRGRRDRGRGGRRRCRAQARDRVLPRPQRHARPPAGHRGRGERHPVVRVPRGRGRRARPRRLYAEWCERPEGTVPELTGIDEDAARALVDAELARRSPEAGQTGTGSTRRPPPGCAGASASRSSPRSSRRRRRRPSRRPRPSATRSP